MISFSNLGLDSMTPLASFNSLLLSLEAFRNGELEEAQLQVELEAVQQELGQIAMIFRWELPYQERQGAWENPLVRAQIELEQSEGLLFQLGELVEQQGWSAVEAEGLNPLRQRLTRLFERFSELRQLEEARPRLSPSAPVHELLRCCALYDSGALSQELLRRRVDSVQHHFAGLARQLQEQPLRHEVVDRVLDLLDVQEEAFRSIMEQLDQDLRPLRRQTLEVLAQAAEEAWKCHQSLQDLQGRETGWCDACEGLVLAEEAAVCADCGGALRSPGGSEEALPSHLQALLESLRRVGQSPQESSWLEFEKHWQEARQRTESVLGQWRQAAARLKEAPPVDFGQVLMEFLEALGRLEPALTSRDALLLISSSDPLVESCHEMVDSVREAQLWMQSQQVGEV